MEFLLAFAALSSLAPAQVDPLVDANAFGSLLSQPRFYDGLMIGTALGPPVAHPIPGFPYFASQPFRVEDSRAFAPGAVVDVFYFVSGGGSAVAYGETPGAPPLPPGTPLLRLGAPLAGARMLIVGSASSGGVLPVLTPGNIDVRSVERVPLGEKARPAVLQITQFPTTRTRLPPLADPKWRFLGALAAAIPGTGDANVRAIADLISVDREYRRPFGVPDDRLSMLFADAVAKETPYHRALVDYALNRLGYWGYGDQFRIDMRAAADDPNAFPDGIPRLGFTEDPNDNPGLHKGYRHDPPLTQSEILTLLMRAKSPAIAETYLGVLYQKPDDADVKALAARFLDAPDPRPRRAMVGRLAAWNGLPAPDPVKETLDDLRVWHYEAPPGLDAAVAFWKRRLALP